MTAVSLGVKTRASFEMTLNGLELPGRAVDGVFVHHLVIDDHREAVEIGLLGDRLPFADLRGLFGESR